MILTMKGRSTMIEFLANASPYQAFIICGLIALVPFLLFYDPADFETRDPWTEKLAEKIQEIKETKTDEKIAAEKKQAPGA
ncbi:MAG TPA: hypothetical protein PLR20_09480 [Syntrophales bacterium]|nr:hypothetical protein [Syntrophales bacterium]HOX95290.1 hypothetical protein [Syntrophales bacterium]HPI57997.1 hypothetical protein [Syntrophales bacterium]HPN25875.1 hypothetical protein [Syntrophales bacterium]HQM29569.1 hypothetical protein [Syntrophales bacterium]